MLDLPESTPCEHVVESTFTAIKLRYVREKRFRVPELGVIFVDFYVSPLKLVVEVDGPSHDLPEQRLIDRLRDSFHALHGRRTCRIRNEELLQGSAPTDIVIDRLLDNGYLNYLRVERVEQTVDAVRIATEKTYHSVDRAYVVARNARLIEGALKAGFLFEESSERAHLVVRGCGCRYHIAEPTFVLEATRPLCSFCGRRK